MHENLMKLPKHESASFYDKNSNRTGTGHGLDGSTKCDYISPGISM